MEVFILFIIWLLLAVGVGFLAETRGRSGFGFFLLSAVLSPIVGFLVLVVVRDLAAEARKALVRNDERRNNLTLVRSLAKTKPVEVADEILKLDGLRLKGLLTEKEFETQKAHLLSTESVSTSVDLLNVTCARCGASTFPDAVACPGCGAKFFRQK